MNGLRVDEIAQILACQTLVRIRTTSQCRPLARRGGGSLALDQAIVSADVIDAVVIASRISSKLRSPLSMGASRRDMTHCCDVSDYAVTITPIPAYVPVYCVGSLVID